jgi:hypothetical protein
VRFLAHRSSRAALPFGVRALPSALRALTLAMREHLAQLEPRGRKRSPVREPPLRFGFCHLISCSRGILDARLHVVVPNPRSMEARARRI